MSKQEQTLNQQLLSVVDSYAGRTCFKVKQGRRYQNVSYHRCQHMVFKMARFFTSRGISNGERVAIVAENSLEWMVTYLACLLSGGVAVPLRTSLALDTLHHVLKDSGAAMVVLEDPKYIQFVADNLNSSGEDRLSKLNTILTIADKKDETGLSDGVF